MAWAVPYLQEAIDDLGTDVVLVRSEELGLDEPIRTSRNVVLCPHILPYSRLISWGSLD